MSDAYAIRYFLGANSPQGFYSLYSELLPPETASAVYILKGGPGCGKSTLMGRVAEQLARAGETVEYILCSGDPASLDGVVLPRLGAALVDGTAPHIVEPKYPGVVEQYVNLGVCYDRAGLQEVRAELLGAMTGYKEHYRRAYRCLGAAEEILTDVRAALATRELEEKLSKRAKGILRRELKPLGTGQAGAVKQRFLDGVTHLGCSPCGTQCWPSAPGSTSCPTGTARPTRYSPGCRPGRCWGAMTRWPVPTPWPRSGWPICWSPRRGWPLSPLSRSAPSRGSRTAGCGWRPWRTRSCSAAAAPGCALP